MTDYEHWNAQRAARKAAGVTYDDAEHRPHRYDEAARARSYQHLPEAEIAAAADECARYGLPELYKWQIAHNAWIAEHADVIKAWAREQGVWPKGARKVSPSVAALYLHGGTTFGEPRQITPGYAAASR